MALSTNLVRRGGIYYFRCRVPLDLVSRVQRNELIRSLRTASPVAARQRASWVAFLTIRLWDALRMTLDSTEINALVKRWLQAALVQDEVARTRPEFAEGMAQLTGQGLEETANSLIGTEAEDRMVEWRDHYRNGRWREAEPYARQILADAGLSIATDSDEYRLLCIRLCLAAAELHGTRMERSLGNWSYDPVASLDKLEPVLISQTSSASTAKEPPKGASASGAEIGKLIEQYLEERERVHREKRKRIMDRRISLEMLRDWVGANTDIKALQPTDIGAFRSALTQLPPNYRKRLPGLSIKEAHKKALDEKLPGMKPPTASGHVILVKAFFDWCIESGFTERSPAENIKLSTKGSRYKEDTPGVFDADSLKRLFSAPLYTGCRSERFVFQPGTAKPHHWKFWLPLLGHFTGARLGEIAQLRPCDVKQIDDVWVISINDEDGRSVKNRASIRDVPIADELIRIGVIDLAHSQAKKNPKGPLLPGIPKPVAGPASNKPSDWFAKFCRKTGLETSAGGQRLVFHSFRHTMVTRLREVHGFDEWAKHRLVGHHFDHSSGTYGDSVTKALKRLVDAIDFRVDLSHLP